jgi:signal transduction histidine kinase
MSQAHILLIEDNPVAAENLQKCLTHLGYAIAAATSAADQAVPLAEQFRPDLVLLALPLAAPADAVAVAGQLRTGLRLPVVFLATGVDEATLRRAEAALPFGYVFMPADEPRLRAVVEAALARRRAEDAVTAERTLEEQARAAERMEAVGRLAGGIAHEFNNLLTVVNGYSSLLLAGSSADHPWHGFVLEIHRAGERAADLTRQLLAFSRRQLLQPRVLDVNQIVTAVAPLLRRVLGEGISLVTSLGTELPSVRADPGQLEQVLMSLAGNARDAMPSGGVLSVETSSLNLTDADAAGHPGMPPGAYVALRVRDNGHGMTEAVRARAFEPFFTTKPFGKGSGMGLAGVYGIVTQSGGYIEVASAVGQGACFSIYLPPAPGQADDPPAPGLPGLPRGTETLLLVEDDEGVRKLNRQVLRLCGYTVLEASHGAEALRDSSQYAGRVDLLVTDVVMPEISGLQLADALAGQRPGLKVLFLSGYSEGDRPGDGAAYFLAKPYAPADLARKVREILDGGKGSLGPGPQGGGA